MPRLQPAVLHRIIEHCGLEESGALLSLATPEQLNGVLDLDLWRSPQAGHDERFTPERFGAWLEVLADLDADVAAGMLAGLDPAMTAAGLAQYIRVFDGAATAAAEGTDDEPYDPASEQPVYDREIAGYYVVGRRPDAWDAIVTLLASMDAGHPEAFHRVMRACRSLSNSAPETDGLDPLLSAPDQLMFDLASGREQRRELHGYAVPAHARAFLHAARLLRVGEHAAPPASPLAAAHFRAMADAPADAGGGNATDLPAGDTATPTADGALAGPSLADVLVDAGILLPPPRALLEGAAQQPSTLSFIRSRLRSTYDSAPLAHLGRTQELAFLANTLVVGCALQGRAFTVGEASEAAVAVCNLGLENWPSHWLRPTAGARAASTSGVPLDFLVDHDLISVFQVGWAVLHQQVCMAGAEALVRVLGSVTCDERSTRAELKALRTTLRKAWLAGTPWTARGSLDVLTALDAPAWAACVGLLDECPVLHAALDARRQGRLLRVSASDFDFISENSQLERIRQFLQELPATLAG